MIGSIGPNQYLIQCCHQVSSTETDALLLLRSRGCFDLYAVLRSDSDQGSDIGLRVLKLNCCFPEKPVKASWHTDYGVFGGVPANDFEIMSLTPHQINHVAWLTRKGSIILIKLQYSFVDDKGFIFDGMSVRRRSLARRVGEGHDAHGVVGLVRFGDHIAWSECVHDSVRPITRPFTGKDTVGFSHNAAKSNLLSTSA